MKIKKIAAICKNAKRIKIFEKDDLQYIGTGSVIFPLYGLTTLDFEDCADFENLLEPSKICINYNGKNIMPLETSQGIVFIDSSLLAPIQDESELMELYERTTTDNEPYIVAKAGFMLLAIIMPFKVIDEKFCKNLQELALKCFATFNSKKTDD